MHATNRNTNLLGLGLLGAAAAGAVLGLLFAPKPGKETRATLSEKLKKGMDELTAAPEKVVDELNKRIDSFGHDVPEDQIEKMKPYYNRMVNVRDRLIMAINKNEPEQVTSIRQEARDLLNEVKHDSKAKKS